MHAARGSLARIASSSRFRSLWFLRMPRSASRRLEQPATQRRRQALWRRARSGTWRPGFRRDVRQGDGKGSDSRCRLADGSASARCRLSDGPDAREDRYLSLADRAAVANDEKNSLFVSIHFNDGDHAAAASGVETYFAARQATSDCRASGLVLFSPAAPEAKPLTGEEREPGAVSSGRARPTALRR